MAEALYRKYRPQVFEDVVGQEQIERTIKNAIDQDKVSHAYLFCGPRGTGKTTTARLLAKALLCEKGPTANPDGTCEDCQMIADGVHPDVYELDAASRTGVENVREEIINRVQFAPTRGRYKVYIIDEVHMLSIAAFNALLKTLEEPPDHVVFILATTDPQKVPETIHSRCQRFDFRRISNESIVSRLGAVCVSEGVEFEGDALDLIAHHAGGGMRNALTSLEQMIAFGEGKVTLEVAERMLGGVDSNDLSDIMRALGARDAAACFKWVAEFTETGADLAQFARELAQHVRNLYVMSLTDSSVAVEVSASERRQLEAELPQFGSDRLARMLSVLGDVMAELKTSTNPRLTFEIALTRMVRPEGDLTLAALAERVEALEAGGAGVAAVSGTSAVAAGAMPVASAQTMAPATPAIMRGPAPAPVPAPQPAPVPAPKQIPNASARTAPQQSAAAPAVATPAAATNAAAAASAAANASVPAAAPVTDNASASAAASTSANAANPQLAAMFSNPAALQRVWQATLATLKRNKAAYGVLFLGTKASYDAAANVFNIEFPAENAFAFKAVQKPDAQAAVGEALSQACGGQAVPFAISQAGNAAFPVAAAVQAPVAAPAPRPQAAAPQPAPAPAPAPTPQPQPAAAPTPAPAPQQQAQPQQAKRAAADVLPWEDEQVPYDDAMAVSFDEDVQENVSAQAATPAARQAAPSQAPASAPAQAPAAAPSQVPAAATTQAPSQAPATPSTNSSDATQAPDDLQSILQAGFGGDVSFEEVN